MEPFKKKCEIRIVQARGRYSLENGNFTRQMHKADNDKKFEISARNKYGFVP